MSLLRRTTELAEEYLDGLAERPVAALAGYEETLAALDAPLPAAGEAPAAVIESLAATVGPATVASAGPRYFGFVIGGSLPVALAADWLVSAWDQDAFSRVMSPAGAAVEEATQRLTLEALGLPAGAAVGFVTGATAANFVGILAARHRLLEGVGWNVEARGLIGAPPLRILVGEEVHPSLLVALRMAGLGADVAERVGAGPQGAMRADALADALARADGPVLVCAQAGNVNTGASDPFREIVAAARERGQCWVHVDGAFGLWAAVSPSLRSLLDGVEGADSWSVDAHKWLNVPYDSALAIVAEPDAARAALGTSASYLPSSGGREPHEHVPEMSRRARAVPVYAALRSLGRTGLVELVERCCTHARRLEEAIADLDGAEVLNDVVLNQVLVRFGDDDAIIERGRRARPPRRRGLGRGDGVARAGCGPGLVLELVDHGRGRRPSRRRVRGGTRSSLNGVETLIDVAAPLLLIAVAAAYAKRSATLAARGQPVELWRRICFAAAMALLLVADLPPLAGIAEELIVAHMVQHLIIGDLAGLLLALGLTGPLLQPLLARRPFAWLRFLGHPFAALPLWALNLYLWHLSVLYQGVLDSPAAPSRPARGLPHLRACDVAAARRAAAEARLVRRCREARLHHRRPAARGGARERADLVGGGPLSGLRAR